MWNAFYRLTIIGFLLMAIPAHGEDSGCQAGTSLLGSDWRGEVIGVNDVHNIKPKETLIDLAPNKMLGYNNLKNANPAVDPWLPRPGQEVVLPYAAILPLDAEPGITINLAELRLFYIWREKDQYRARAYPVGIGTEETETPVGNYRVMNKTENPTWTVPLSILAQRPGFPAMVPPGPANPLGKFWMQFSPEGYGLHGTNKPMGVGRRVSHGCIRLYPQGIRDLFARTAVGTPVRIINRPVKVGRQGATLLLEVHVGAPGDAKVLRQEIVDQTQALDWHGMLDWDRIAQVLREKRGLPTPISIAEPQYASGQQAAAH